MFYLKTKEIWTFLSSSAINGVRRSPSCSTLNLTDRDDSRTVEMDTVSEGGDRHSKQRRSASQKQRSRPSQQRGRQGVKRPPSLSTPGWGSDFAPAPSTSSKKAHWATTPEESKRELFFYIFPL